MASTISADNGPENQVEGLQPPQLSKWELNEQRIEKLNSKAQRKTSRNQSPTEPSDTPGDGRTSPKTDYNKLISFPLPPNQLENVLTAAAPDLASPRNAERGFPDLGQRSARRQRNQRNRQHENGQQEIKQANAMKHKELTNPGKVDEQLDL